MEHKKIVIPSLSFFQNELKGEGVVKSRRTLGELTGIFENQDAYSQLPLDQLAYEVYSYLPEREGTPGGLYFGITQLYPGKVGVFHDERPFSSTRGSFGVLLGIGRRRYVDLDGPGTEYVGGKDDAG